MGDRGCRRGVRGRDLLSREPKAIPRGSSLLHERKKEKSSSGGESSFPSAKKSGDFLFHRHPPSSQSPQPS